MRDGGELPVHGHGEGHGEDDERFGTVVRAEWRGAAHAAGEDDLAREEPLEIRVGPAALAVVMRTPGHDDELVRGFLLTERIVSRPGDVATARHCDTVEVPEAEGNVFTVTLAPDVPFDLAHLRRNLYASSSCGVCGKATIAAAMGTAPPIEDALHLPAGVLYALPEKLRAGQEVFGRTGGLHAAGLFGPDGTPWVVREDVGRHNAVDKVVGWAARAGRWPLSGCVLMVSGRVSYEVVQKAVAARVPVVCAVSAPTTLAVEVARAAGLTLVGFLRGERMCVYSGEGRVVGS